MGLLRKRILLAVAVCLYFCPLLLTAQLAKATPPRIESPRSSCPASDPNRAPVVRAQSGAVAVLNLCDGRPLAGNSSGIVTAQPLVLSSADFDEDGVPDLVSGYASGKTGFVTVHRGNRDALWPYGAALRNGTLPSFLPNARRFDLPLAPDFIATGDFDADGHWDIVAAQRGSDALTFLKGDGHGGFRAPQRIALAGSVTAMISGEVNRADGLSDLIVALNTQSGSRVLVFESPSGAVKAQPEIFKFAEPVTALALGRFRGGAMLDLAVGTGNDLVLIQGRDRKLSLGIDQRTTVALAKMTVQRMGYTIAALEAGDFTGAGPSLAVLGDDKRVHILEHAVTESSLLGKALTDPDFVPTMRTAGHAGKADEPAVSGHVTPSQTQRLAAIREMARQVGEAPEWAERSSVALPVGFAQSAPRMRAGRVSGSIEEDLLIPDSGNRQLHLLSVPRQARDLAGKELGVTRNSMRVLASLEAESAPVTVLPMRLGRQGLKGLVVLQAGQSTPTVMPQDTPPSAIFTVTNTSDAVLMSSPGQYTGPAGSLRKAIADAQDAGGSSEIVFNIPTTDPGYNPATGSFLIQPLSESIPGADNNFALNPIGSTVLIDGYTQPGASPNTLANGDNARLLIQIDGKKASTPGGAGLSPFDDVGSVYRGMIFTGWINPDISSGSTGETASGAAGIEAGGVQDYIEGNFFGVDSTGKTAAPNRLGVFVYGGPGFGSTDGGNIIGGTTPQARNILSGNNNSGILFLSTAIEAQLQGNFVGPDITGAAIPTGGEDANRSNLSDGAGLNGPTVTIGGALPGTGNVISGNGTNVDINDLTEGNQANDSTVQGNLIGTDATGELTFPDQGYGVSILNNPTDMLIGGTTPAARNVISGNFAGVYIFDNSFFNNVQGNYIGIDVTGAKAIPNTQQGFITGATTAEAVPAGDTAIGGTVAGAGNVISGNTMDGIQISGTSNDSGEGANQGNYIFGNLIGTDPTGKVSIPNGGNGVDLISSATNNIIGGSEPGLGNTISNNTLNGVLIDPGTTAGTGTGNNTVANIIQSNGGSGVRINTGSGNRISQNSIFKNGNLGINLQNAGANLNTTCQASNTGANNLQNAPVLTAGPGAAYITATATDPNGNTSEFSNAVKESLSGSVLDLLGNFNSTANTTYTIEFFSSTSADASGYGEGQTYLTSTSVTTGTNCNSSISNPVDTADADLSVTITPNTTDFVVGPDFGQYTLTALVTNNGLATATNVILVDTLPAGLEVSSAYCDVGPCQSPITSSLGNCTVSGSKITCNLGTMASGAHAITTIPVETTATGNLTDTASVTATQTDPNLVNNTASVTVASDYNFPFIDHIDPVSALTQTSGSLTIDIYGNGFMPTSAVTFNNTAVPTTAYLDNQVCGLPFNPAYCTEIQVSVPASLLGTAGAGTVTVTNPDPGIGGEPNTPTTATFTLVSACSITAQDFGFNPVENEGDTLIPESISVTANAPTCPWAATSDSSWLVILDHQRGTGSGTVDVSVAPNTGAARTGHVTVAGTPVEIDQSAGDSTVCTYGVPGPLAIPAAGISSSFAVTTGSECSYYVQPYPQDSQYVTGVQFIDIPSSSGLLVGNGNPAYSVEPNYGAPRTGTIFVGGDVVTLNQAAPTCYYTLTTTGATIPVGGSTGTIGVTPSSPSCAWTAKSSNTSLISVTSGATGTGNGTVGYSVPANPGGPQTATITIGDATGHSVFTETQVSAFNCTFTISPTSVEVSSNGVSNFVQITASYGNCHWTAISSDPTALSINDVEGINGLSTNGTAVGTGVIYYRVAQNPTSTPRVLTIVAGCQTFTINQDGTATSNPAPTISSISPSTAVAGSGAFTLTVNGSNFVSDSLVNFNGSPRTTTFVSANQLTAAILATDVAAVGTPAVTVTNPAPGGGTSNAVNFPITAATAPIATLTPTSLSFSATVGTTSTAQIVTLKNTGSAALTISGISLGGGNPSGFAQTNTCGTSVAAGANCTISVTFTPESAANYGATLSVADNAAGSPQSLALSGTGTAAAAPNVSLSPASLSYGNQLIGTPSAARAITLTNTGAASLNISGSSIVGTGVAGFTKTTTCGSVLPAGSQCTFSLIFQPQSTGGFSASLSIADNAAGSPQSVALSGIGVAPVVALSATSLAFGNQITGTTSAAQTVTLTNVGTGPLLVDSISRVGANINAFAENDACAALSPIAVGSSCTISVKFLPTAVQSYSVSLTIVDDAGNSPQSISITGAGVAAKPVVTLLPSTLNFGNVTAGTTSAPMLLTLSNSGTAPFPLSSTSFGGSTAFALSPTGLTCGISVAAGSSCVYSVAFTPPTAAAFSATFTVTDATDSVSVSASLSGTGTAAAAPTATLSPTALAFGSVTENTSSAAQTVTLTNTGTASLTGIVITLQESLNDNLRHTARARVRSASISSTSDYSATTTCGATLAAGSTCTISVSFDPATTGSLPGTLRVTDSASNSPQSAALSGTGTAPLTLDATLSPASLAFGSVTESTSSAAQTVTLTNTGTASLTGIAITLQESSNEEVARHGLSRARVRSASISSTSDYSATTTCGATLAAGSTCTVSVIFDPSSIGSLAGSLLVTDNASNSPQSAALSGTGTAPLTLNATLSPASLAFGSVTESTPSAAQTITLSNTGTGSLTGIVITLQESSSDGLRPAVNRVHTLTSISPTSDYSATTTCGSTLAAGSTCTVAVIFNPSSTGSLPGTLFVTDDASNSPQSASLSGTGIAAVAPAVTLTPSSLTFTAVAATTTAAQIAVLKNTGNASLAITGISLTGTNPTDFTQTNTCGESLASGASCTITVTFTPSATGSFTASVSVADNAPGSPQAVTLTGTGTAPPSFTVSSTTPLQSIQPGGAAVYAITVAAQNGTFAKQVTLTASGLPTGATATFAPASVTPGASSATSQLTIQTSTTTTNLAGTRSGWPLAASLLPLLGLLFATRKQRKKWITLSVLLLASLGAIATLSGCGGGFNLPGSGAKSYSITVTGTSGTEQQTTTVQLTVQ